MGTHQSLFPNSAQEALEMRGITRIEQDVLFRRALLSANAM